MAKLSVDQLKEMAAQLRQPNGEAGLKISDAMNDGNGAMNLHAIAVLNPVLGDRILEIGMGNGLFVKNILGVDDSIVYRGLDFSSLMVDEAEKINEKFITQKRAQFICGNVAEIPFNDFSFNKIVTVNTLYFWDDYPSVFKELSRVLQQDGQLIIAIRPRDVMEQYPMTKYGFRMFTIEEASLLFDQNGFVLLETTRVIEPNLEYFGMPLKRETLVFVLKKK